MTCSDSTPETKSHWGFFMRDVPLQHHTAVHEILGSFALGDDYMMFADNVVFIYDEAVAVAVESFFASLHP